MRYKMSNNKVYLLSICFLSFLFTSNSSATIVEKNILILYSYQPRMPAYELLDKNFRDIQLNQDVHVEYYTEFLELSRFRDKKSIKRLSDFINNKYEIHKPDVVIAVSSPALDFIQNHCQKTFNNTPVIYALIDKDVDLGKLKIKATGVNLHIDLVKTLKSALSIQPDTRDVYVVVGTSVQGRSWQSQAEENFRPFSSQLNFHYLSNLSMDEILRKVSALPPQAIVLYLLIVQDTTQKSFVPREALNQISQSSSVPVYGLWDTFVGYGIIGGHLCSFDALGKKVSKMAARILEGENLETIPSTIMGPNIHMFDWRQMKRFGINKKTIPEESILLFKPQSAWSKYKFYIIGFILTTLLETLLILMLIVNIKKRQFAEKLLLIEKNRLIVTLRSIGDGVITTDTDGRLVLMNRMAEELTGWNQNEAVGKTIDEVFRIINSKTRQKCENPVEKVLEARTIVGLANNTNLIGRDGTERMISDSGSPILNENGEIIGVVIVFQDITEKYRMEKQLKQSQKMEAIGTLAGGIAHDFNNILSPIVGYSELIQDDLPRNSLLRESVAEILRASLRAKDLVQQILTFSRQHDQEFKPVKVQSILMEALKLLESSIPKTIEIQTQIDHNCGVVFADPTQIHQIIMNLATNAYHAMQESGGRLTLNLKQTQIKSNPNRITDLISGDYALLEVIDTGRGIEKQMMDKIFDPYFTTKEKFKGTGLGLSVVQGLIKSCNGDISIYSEPNKGTEVHVYLPIIMKKTDSMRPDLLPLIQGGSERILLVDDERAVLKMEQLMLERLGYRVVSKTGSIDALEAFKANSDKFDLIISDMTMPSMTGVQLANEIKTVRADIPIIICTGFSDQIDKESSKEMGIQGYVVKPLTKRKIAQTIREVLDPCAPK